MQVVEMLAKMESTFLSEVYEEIQERVSALRKRRECRAEESDFQNEPDVFETDGRKVVEASPNEVETPLGTGRVEFACWI